MTLPAALAALVFTVFSLIACGVIVFGPQRSQCHAGQHPHQFGGMAGQRGRRRGGARFWILLCSNGNLLLRRGPGSHAAAGQHAPAQPPSLAVAGQHRRA
ncbi:hypothetical protein [Kibdelosporangium philippinense]|uniref:hypothetical protein n=1 Tax=Kibdelosporangium philippinense TaxID=211113 RepID=UPI00360F370C